ncbi:MAG: sigma factor [Clostridium sp.]|uniref:sigma factor n=1 Tax=Clostridium sp. TaxID=1506 RepID=UPI001A9BFAF5|nr:MULTISPECIES: sigma factor [Clostridium]MDB2123167.1 sigma factor [Clostridium paraputrificum]MDU1586567.1 sigma factor [Clostridium sp.]MDU1977701.1 sigma factor [Clostridium sp.]MDU6047732.1 sigma factor [Clostridium sp.]MDU6271548.1 sigma factor [Clostridium sp.]
MIIERQVLDTLYKKYSNQIYLYIYSLCKDNLLAQDLMQDTFFKALISIESSDEDILPWLYKVARNLYIDQWRKRKRYIVQGIENIDIYNEDDVIDKLLVEEQKMIL